jgi:hypothetical protein
MSLKTGLISTAPLTPLSPRTSKFLEPEIQGHKIVGRGILNLGLGIMLRSKMLSSKQAQYQLLATSTLLNIVCSSCNLSVP